MLMMMALVGVEPSFVQKFFDVNWRLTLRPDDHDWKMKYSDRLRCAVCGCSWMCHNGDGCPIPNHRSHQDRDFGNRWPHPIISLTAMSSST